MAIELVSILGAGHSGSTLLDMILGSHPFSLSLGEISNFNQYVQDNRACTCGKSVRNCPLWSQVLNHLECLGYNIGQLADNFVVMRRKSDDSLLVKAGHFISIASFLAIGSELAGEITRFTAPTTYERTCNIHQLYDATRLTTRRQLIVDSSKSVHRFRLLHTLRPDSTRGIFLTRDGRGVMASLMNRANLPATTAARKWKRGQLYTLRMLRTLSATAYLHVRYEALCREPETTLHNICAFLKIPFDDASLDFRKREHHNIGGNRMRFTGEQAIKESVAWREELNEEENKSFERIAGSLNRQLMGKYFVP